MTNPDLRPLVLPKSALERILALGRQSDCLILGECHGTQEVPRVVLGLLEGLSGEGYGALALEVHAHERAPLEEWARGERSDPPVFWTRPGDDGLGSIQLLKLATESVMRGWRVLCFNLGREQQYEDWQQRDRDMAGNLLGQWRKISPDRRVLAICGNLHSRISQPLGDLAQFWPSFAAILATESGKRIHSIDVRYHGGSFYNAGRVQGLLEVGNLPEPFVEDGSETQHTLALHLPRATPVTFLASPTDRQGR